MENWIMAYDRLPEKKGQYLVAYHPCYWDKVQTDKVLVGIDTFRGKSKWAQNKYQFVIAWQSLPDAPDIDEMRLWNEIKNTNTALDAEEN